MDPQSFTDLFTLDDRFFEHSANDAAGEHDTVVLDDTRLEIEDGASGLLDINASEETVKRRCENEDEREEDTEEEEEEEEEEERRLTDVCEEEVGEEEEEEERRLTDVCEEEVGEEEEEEERRLTDVCEEEVSEEEEEEEEGRRLTEVCEDEEGAEEEEEEEDETVFERAEKSANGGSKVTFAPTLVETVSVASSMPCASPVLPTRRMSMSERKREIAQHRASVRLENERLAGLSSKKALELPKQLGTDTYSALDDIWEGRFESAEVKLQEEMGRSSDPFAHVRWAESHMLRLLLCGEFATLAEEVVSRFKEAEACCEAASQDMARRLQAAMEEAEVLVKRHPSSFPIPPSSPPPPQDQPESILVKSSRPHSASSTREASPRDKDRSSFAASAASKVTRSLESARDRGRASFTAAVASSLAKLPLERRAEKAHGAAKAKTTLAARGRRASLLSPLTTTLANTVRGGARGAFDAGKISANHFERTRTERVYLAEWRRLRGGVAMSLFGSGLALLATGSAVRAAIFFRKAKRVVDSALNNADARAADVPGCMLALLQCIFRIFFTSSNLLAGGGVAGLDPREDTGGGDLLVSSLIGFGGSRDVSAAGETARGKGGRRMSVSFLRGRGDATAETLQESQDSVERLERLLRVTMEAEGEAASGDGRGGGEGEVAHFARLALVALSLQASQEEYRSDRALHLKYAEELVSDILHAHPDWVLYRWMYSHVLRRLGRTQEATDCVTALQFDREIYAALPTVRAPAPGDSGALSSGQRRRFASFASFKRRVERAERTDAAASPAGEGGGEAAGGTRRALRRSLSFNRSSQPRAAEYTVPPPMTPREDGVPLPPAMAEVEKGKMSLDVDLAFLHFASRRWRECEETLGPIVANGGRFQARTSAFVMLAACRCMQGDVDGTVDWLERLEAVQAKEPVETATDAAWRRKVDAMALRPHKKVMAYEFAYFFDILKWFDHDVAGTIRAGDKYMSHEWLQRAHEDLEAMCHAATVNVVHPSHPGLKRVAEEELLTVLLVHGCVASMRGELSAAEEMFRSVAENAQGGGGGGDADPWHLPFVMYELGSLELRKGAPVNAIEYFKQAERMLKPRNFSFHHVLAYRMARARRFIILRYPFLVASSYLASKYTSTAADSSVEGFGGFVSAPRRVRKLLHLPRLAVSGPPEPPSYVGNSTVMNLGRGGWKLDELGQWATFMPATRLAPRGVTTRRENVLLNTFSRNQFKTRLVPRGERFELRHIIKESESVSWVWKVESHDIGFQVFFTPFKPGLGAGISTLGKAIKLTNYHLTPPEYRSDSDTVSGSDELPREDIRDVRIDTRNIDDAEEVVFFKRYEAGDPVEGMYASSTHGMLHFVWDNSFTKYTDKTVLYMLAAI